jgi:hypothetical protein
MRIVLWCLLGAAAVLAAVVRFRRPKAPPIDPSLYRLTDEQREEATRELEEYFRRCRGGRGWPS